MEEDAIKLRTKRICARMEAEKKAEEVLEEEFRQLLHERHYFEMLL